MFVSELDIEAAGLLVRQAEDEVRAAEQLPPTSTTGIAWAAAQGRLRTAVANHARLVERHAAEQAAEAMAAKAEKAAAKRLAAMAAENEASRAKLHAAITAAQDAMVALTMATDEYNAQVEAQHDELEALGLRLVEGTERVNGSRRQAGVRVVLLDGVKWAPVGREAVLMFVCERVRRARQSFRHNGLSLRAFAQNLGLGYGRADLDLGSVPLPTEIEHQELKVPYYEMPGPRPLTDAEHAQMLRNRFEPSHPIRNTGRAPERA